jgi:hypothetical protein
MSIHKFLSESILLHYAYKNITAFEGTLSNVFPSPQNAFCFTNLSHLVLEIFRVFEYHVQNLNIPQNNSASWDLQMGFNSAFKGLKNNQDRYGVS